MEEVPSISFFTLVSSFLLIKLVDKTVFHNIYLIFLFLQYRYATGKDKFFIAVSIIFSIICGCGTPFNTILFANLLQSMVDYGISTLLGNPDDEMFLKAILDFAIYNCIIGILLVILSYGATVLMNIAAYNQVYISNNC